MSTRGLWGILLAAALVAWGSPARAQSLELVSFVCNNFTNITSYCTVRAGTASQRIEVYGVYLTTAGDLASVKFLDTSGDLTPFMDLTSTKAITLPMNIVRGADSWWLRGATGSLISMGVSGHFKDVGGNSVRGIATIIRQPQ